MIDSVALPLLSYRIVSELAFLLEHMREGERDGEDPHTADELKEFWLQIIDRLSDDLVEKE